MSFKPDLSGTDCIELGVCAVHCIRLMSFGVVCISASGYSDWVLFAQKPQGIAEKPSAFALYVKDQVESGIVTSEVCHHCCIMFVVCD